MRLVATRKNDLECLNGTQTAELLLL